MPIPFRSAVPDSDPREGELRRSKSERTTAQKAFDHALNQELQEVIRQAKQMAAAIKQPLDLWELEHHLTPRRKEIDHSVKTTERHLGCKQDLGNSANAGLAPIANTPNSLAKAGRKRTA